MILLKGNASSPRNAKANAAMKELREKYDKSYGWCYDCDGLVVKKKDCCLIKDLKSIK